MKHLHQLIAQGGPALAGPLSSTEPLSDRIPLHVDAQLRSMLAIKNGFYAFENALHVFPSHSGGATMDLEGWNREETWKFEYQGLADGLFCFAEDAFGWQFCIHESGIVLFNPEDASLEPIATDIYGWVKAVLDDHYGLTACTFAHAWQRKHGQLADGRRLTFKIPLILSGEAAMENVGDISAIEGMHARGYLWNQIRDLPDGTQISLEVVD